MSYNLPIKPGNFASAEDHNAAINAELQKIRDAAVLASSDPAGAEAIALRVEAAAEEARAWAESDSAPDPTVPTSQSAKALAAQAATSAVTAAAAIDRAFLPRARPSWTAVFGENLPLPDDLVFTRATPTTRRNRAGLLETVGAGLPAHHYGADGVYCGIAIFGAATQLVPDDQIFALTGATLTGAVVTAASAVGPDGQSNSAANVTRAAASTSSSVRIDNLDTTNAHGHCFSTFVKAGAVTWVGLSVRVEDTDQGMTSFDLATGMVGTVASGWRAEIEAWGNDWYRVSIAKDFTATNDVDLVLTLLEGDDDASFADAAAGTEGIEVYGLNLTNTDGPMPLHRTAGDAANTIVYSESTGFNPDRGVFYAEAAIQFFNTASDGLHGGNGILTNRPSSLRGTFLEGVGAGDGVIMSQRNSSTNPTVFRTYSESSSEVFRVAGAWGAQGYLLSLRGASDNYAGTKSNDTPSDDRVWLGRFSRTGNVSDRAFLQGYMRAAAIWATDLPATDVHALTQHGLNFVAAQVEAPRIQPRGHYVDAREYVPQDDTLDCWDGVQAAMLAAEGREMRFSTPYGGSRTYRFTDRSKGLIQSILQGKIEWDANALCDFEGWGTTGLGTGGTGQAFFQSDGVFAASVAVTSDVTAGSRSVSVANAAGFVRGTRFVLQTNELYTPMNTDLGDIGEWCTVASVSGNTITTTNRIRHNYTVSGYTVTVHRGTKLVKLNLVNPQWIGPGILGGALVDGAGPRGDRGFEVINADYLTVEGGDMQESDQYQIIATNVRRGEIKGANFIKTQPQPSGDLRIRYHVGIAGVSELFITEGNMFDGGTEHVSPTITGGLVSGGESPDAITGLKDTLIHRFNEHRNAWRSGLSPHHAYVDLQVTGNMVDDCNQAFDMRLGGTCIGNVIKRTGGGGLGNLDCGIQIGSGAGDFYGANNVFEDVLRGYWMQQSTDHWRAPRDFVVAGDVMRGVRGQGVLLDYNGGSGASVDADLGRLSIRAHIELATTGAPRGVEAYGRWREPDIDVTVVGGTADSRDVFLSRAEDSVSATGGPINPIIKTRRSANIDPPVVGSPANGAGSLSITSEVFGGEA